MVQHALSDRTIPLQSVQSMALNAMTVECERFIYVRTIFDHSMGLNLSHNNNFDHRKYKDIQYSLRFFWCY